MNSNIKNTIIILSAVVIMGGALVIGVKFGAFKLVNESGTSSTTSQSTQANSASLPAGQTGAPTGQTGAPTGQTGAPAGQTMDFSALVENGIVDQDTADKMEAYMADQMQSLGEISQDTATNEKPDILSGMVEAGILTQEQADEIEASAPQMDSQGLPPAGVGNNASAPVQ